MGGRLNAKRRRCSTNADWQSRFLQMPISYCCNELIDILQGFERQSYAAITEISLAPVFESGSYLNNSNAL